jgi:hypothetical protein
LFEDASLKRGADDLFRLEVSLPFDLTDFERAVRLLHEPQPWSMDASTCLSVFRVLDYLDVDRSGIQVRLTASSPDSEKIAYLRLCADTAFLKTPAWALCASVDRCFERRPPADLGDYLSFADEAIRVVREEWGPDHDELLAEHVDTRLRAELLRFRAVSSYAAFWEEASTGLDADRLAVLRRAFPVAVCAWHARKRGQSASGLGDFEAGLDIVDALAHRLLTSGLGAGGVDVSSLALSRTSASGAYLGVLAVPLDRDAAVRLPGVGSLHSHAGAANFKLKKALLPKAVVHAWTSANDALTELSLETVPTPAAPTGVVVVLVSLPAAPVS